MSKTRSLIALVIMGFSSAAVAQEHPIVDAGGYQQNHDGFSGAPFEDIDTLNGGLVLTFTDLVLPGNAGRDLRLQRTYNSKGKARGQWSFGLAGYVLRIDDPTVAAAPPIFFPADGSLQRTVFTQSGSTNLASTSGFAQYNRSARTLSMPDGTTCYYEAPTATERRLTHCYSVFGAYSFPPVKEVELVWGAGTLTVTQHLGNGQTRTVDVTLEGGMLLPATMTFLGRTWTYEYTTPLESRPPVISGVTPPLGPGWTFDYQVHQPGVPLPPDDTELHHPDNPRHRPEIELIKVTTPQGGIIQYGYGDAAFARVDFVEGDPPTRMDTVSRVVRTRRTEDDGLTLGSWTYAYTDSGNAQHTLVESSVGTRTTYRYEALAPQADVFDGGSWGMRSRTTEGLQGETWAVLEDEALQYQVMPVVQSGRGTPEVTSRTITRGGRCVRGCQVQSSAAVRDVDAKPYVWNPILSARKQIKCLSQSDETVGKRWRDWVADLGERSLGDGYYGRTRGSATWPVPIERK